MSASSENRPPNQIAGSINRLTFWQVWKRKCHIIRILAGSYSGFLARFPVCLCGQPPKLPPPALFPSAAYFDNDVKEESYFWDGDVSTGSLKQACVRMGAIINAPKSISHTEKEHLFRH